MKKRVLAGIMMAVMMMASVMGVSAAGSKTEEVSASVNSASTYTISAGDESLKASLQAAMTSGKQIITSSPVWNITGSDSAAADTANGKYVVELTVSALTSNCSDVEVLSYVDGAWKKVTVSSVKDNVIVVELDSKDAVIAICANVASDSVAGTSPSTGVTSSAWLICLAVVVMAVGVVTLKKSR